MGQQKLKLIIQSLIQGKPLSAKLFFVIETEMKVVLLRNRMSYNIYLGRA